MKYKSILFDEARNKIGGIVASANKDGNYFREKVTPRNPRTAAQQAVRSSFTANSKAWRELTDPQRQGWTNLAAQVTLSDTLGNKYKPSGQQLYVSCNSNLATLGDPPIANPPGVPDTLPQLSNLVIVASVETAAPHTHLLTLQFDGGSSSYDVVCSATPQFSAGRSFVGPSQFRYLTDAAGVHTSPFDITIPYEDMFGLLVVGAKLSLSIKAISSNGFAGAPLRADVIVAAV